MAIPLTSWLGKEVLITEQMRLTVNESRPKCENHTLHWRTRRGGGWRSPSPDCGSPLTSAPGGEKVGAGGSAALGRRLSTKPVPLVLKKYPQT